MDYHGILWESMGKEIKKINDIDIQKNKIKLGFVRF